MAIDGVAKSSPKDLASLSEDPAFREFFKLQEGFEWNGTDLCLAHNLLVAHHS